MSKGKKMHTHKRRVRNGPLALKGRRENALDNLLKVKDPDKRQAAEIETLQKRIGGRRSTTTAESAVSATLKTVRADG